MYMARSNGNAVVGIWYVTVSYSLEVTGVCDE